jgi:branched-chain amino acid transport system ATP-binding protein
MSMHPMADDQDCLEVENLEVVYHRVAIAVQGISLRVPRRSVVALIGVNGAGKTTTLRAISGFLDSEDTRVTAGVIRLSGERLEGKRPEEIAARGIVLVPERNKVFETMSVGDNLALPGAPGMSVQRRRALLDRIYEKVPVLFERRQQLAGCLSGGERQMLAIANALLCDPKFLLVDELSLGLAPFTVNFLMRHLASLRDELGLSILLVEQNVAVGLQAADYGYVMEGGRIVLDGPAAKLLTHEDIREFYLGRPAGVARSYRDVKQYRRSRRWWG